MDFGRLDRRVQFEREGVTANAFSTEKEGDGSWKIIGNAWANYRPVSDGERWRAGLEEAHELARFTVRYTRATAGVTPRDRLRFQGKAWGIKGIKEIGDRKFLEITAERDALAED